MNEGGKNSIIQTEKESVNDIFYRVFGEFLKDDELYNKIKSGNTLNNNDVEYLIFILNLPEFIYLLLKNIYHNPGSEFFGDLRNFRNTKIIVYLSDFNDSIRSKLNNNASKVVYATEYRGLLKSLIKSIESEKENNKAADVQSETKILVDGIMPKAA